MANTVSNVSTGKPAVGGAIYAAPVGATLPTSVNAVLDNAFVCLGYISEDGVTNSNSVSSEQVKAWGGDTVLSTNTEKPDNFTFTLLEVLNADVLKVVYGAANVTGTIATGIAIKANNNTQDELAVVIDMIMRGNAQKRIAIPDASVSEVGDITYNDSDAVGYETTLSCMPDASGNTHYEYIQKATTT